MPHNSRSHCFWLFAAVAGCAWMCAGDDVVKTPSPSARTRVALHAAIDKNIEYGRQWLEEKDFKSLMQTAEGITVLVSLLARYGEGERWIVAADGLEHAVKSLAAGAGKQDESTAKTSLDQIAERNKALAALPASGKPKPAKRPAIPLRSFMALLDGTHADAKAALTFGEIDQAKQAANALAELGQALSTFHAEAEWRELAGRLTAEAKKAAESASRDAKEIREQLRAIYQRCENCHEERR